MRLPVAMVSLFLVAGSGAHAQVPLTSYADAKGMIDVQRFTCAQLSGTFQEDADAMAMWYSGWYNGLAKKHYFNLPRAKEGLHQVIVHCKANPGKKVIQAIDLVLKEEKKK
jgi:HdeA/HdeB family